MPDTDIINMRIAERMSSHGISEADDRVKMVTGHRDNIKITRPSDLNLAAQILSAQAIE